MTDAEAHALHAATPHIGAETFAANAGRASIWTKGGPDDCQFRDRKLIEAFFRGRREAIAEDRLDNDTEWDTDEDWD